MPAIAPFGPYIQFWRIFFYVLCYHNPRMPKKPVDKSFGKRLTLLRKEKGLTMEELARKLGVSTRSVFYYEKQSKQPPSHLLAKMSKELGVSLEELLGIKPVKTAFDPKEAAFWRNMRKAQALAPKERRILIEFLNALLAKGRKGKS